jgi:hypothetical protein
LECDVVNAGRIHVVSVGVVSTGGAETYIDLDSFWACLTSIWLRIESVIAQVWSTGEHQHTIQSYAYYWIRIL